MILGEESALSPSCDIWSFAIVLLECVTAYLNKGYMCPEFLDDNGDKMDSIFLVYGGFDSPSQEDISEKVAGGWRPKISPAVAHHWPELVSSVSVLRPCAHSPAR